MTKSSPYVSRVVKIPLFMTQWAVQGSPGGSVDTQAGGHSLLGHGAVLGQRPVAERQGAHRWTRQEYWARCAESHDSNLWNNSCTALAHGLVSHSPLKGASENMKIIIFIYVFPTFRIISFEIIK